MLLRASGGGGNTSPASPGYRRIHPNFCEAWPRITIAGLNLADSGGLWIEQNFLDGVITLNGVVAANSGFMFPITTSMILLSVQLTVKSQNLAGAQNQVAFHSGFDGVNFWESAVNVVTEQSAVIAGTILEVSTYIIKVPIHALSKIYTQIALAGTGSGITVTRILGYYD